MSQSFDDKDSASSWEQPAPEGEITYYTLEITTNMTRLGPALIERCVQVGLVSPTRPSSEPARYSSGDIMRLRKVRRLIQELGLNWAGVEIVVRLTDELEALKAELARLRR
jgi:MerR family transcriptional regulator/heat shock protein HspR